MVDLATVAARPVGETEAATVAVGLVGGVHDEGDRIALEVRHLAQVEDDVEIALGVDQILEHGVDACPVVEADLTVDGDDDRSAGPANGEA